MCNVEVVLQKQTNMNCFKVLISSFELLNSSKEIFYNSLVSVFKPNSFFFCFSHYKLESKWQIRLKHLV
jgi:hypothetical protein